MLSLLTLMAALSSPGRAADNEISVELGSFGTSDDRFDLVHDRGQLGTWGVRGGIGLSEHLGVVAGWHHTATGNQVEVESTFDETVSYDGEYLYQNFQAAYRGNHFLVGPKVDTAVWGWFHPYATVQGALFVGQVLFDDDPEVDDNPGQLKATAVSPGGVAAVGWDIIPVHFGGGQSGVGWHLEGGYGLVAAAAYKAKPASGNGDPAEIARFGLGGFYLRTGVGLYF